MAPAVARSDVQDADGATNLITYQWSVDHGGGPVNAAGSGATTATYTPTETDQSGMLSVTAKYRADKAWRFHEIRSGHDAMLLQPRELAAILLQQTD